jgi:hypothetical protein
MPVARAIAPTAEVAPDERAGARAIWARRAFLTLLALLVIAALFGFLGVRARTVTAQAAGGGVTLSVHYAQIARAGLDVPFELTVHRRHGFDDDVVVAVSSSYLELFDRNAIDPEPASATATRDELILRFDPPRANTLVVSIDMQVQSGRHFGRSGSAAVLDARGHELVRTTFKTWLAP